MKLTVSVGILLFLFYKIDIVKTGQAILATDPFYYGAAIFLSLFFLIVASIKFRILLMAGNIEVGIKKIYVINLISMFYTLFLPGDVGGALARFYKFTDQRKEAAFVLASIVVDRLTAVGSQALVGMIALLIAGPTGFGGDSVMILLVSSMALLSTILILLISHSFADLLRRIFTMLFSGFTPVIIKRAFSSLWHAIETFQANRPALLKAMFLSIIFQATIVAMNYLLIKAMGLDLSFIEIAWVVSVATLLQLLPITIAGLGLREAALIILLGYYGISQDIAMAYSILIFSVLIVFGLLGGALELLSFNNATIRRFLGVERRADKKHSNLAE